MRIFIRHAIRFVSLFGGVYLCFIQSVYADTLQPDLSALRMTGPAVVEKVLSPYTILANDNRVIKINGIECLNYDPIEQSDECINLFEKLSELLPRGTKLKLHQTANVRTGRLDRMGQQLAHITYKKPSDGELKDVWLQGQLIEEGLVRVHTRKFSPEIAEQMYQLEHIARLSQIGLWAPTNKSILQAHTITADDVGFQIVEGIIVKVSKVRDYIYLNFGNNWKNDFTIAIPSRLAKDFSRSGISLSNLGQKHVRVRGWVRSYNGPYVEISHTEQLEIDNNLTASPLTPDKPAAIESTNETPLSPIEKIVAQSQKSSGGFGHITVSPDKSKVSDD